MIGARLTQIDDKGTLDLVRENGRVAIAEDGTEAAQHGAMRMNITVGESVIGDTSTNFDYTKFYEIIFKVSASRAEKELEIKRRILGTPGVLRILTFSWTQTVRDVTINGTILTEWGKEGINFEVTPL